MFIVLLLGDRIAGSQGDEFDGAVGAEAGVDGAGVGGFRIERWRGRTAGICGDGTGASSLFLVILH